MIEFTESEVLRYYEARANGLRQHGRELRGACPVHHGKDPNFRVEIATGRCHCHSQCAKGWDIPSLEMELTGQDFVKSKAEVFRLVGRPTPSWQERDIEAVYPYRTASGEISYEVVRKHYSGQDSKKKFSQRRPDGRGGWVWNLGKVPPLPFQFDKLSKMGPDIVIAITEGEKDALNMTRSGWIATCNNGGAGNFKPELAQYFEGRMVAIFPDNDKPGRDHALQVASILHPVAKSVRIIEIPGLPLKGDVSDYLASGKTCEDLYELYEKSNDWTPEWRFVTEVPHENDKYLRSFIAQVEEQGGTAPFWKAAEVEGIPTPFRILTENLGGMRPGEVYVIGGNRGIGKSSLALQFATTALEARCGVLLFSMEMGHRDVFQRIASIDARVNLQLFRKLRKYGDDDTLLEKQETALYASTRKFMGMPILVSTKARVTPEFLTEESKRVKERANIKLVIVDHMQLMDSAGKERSDYEKFTAISRTTKGIAMELGVPLLLVSQTSRNNSRDKRNELEISDLRGSGAIEEDAAAVLLLYYDQEDYKAAKTDQTGFRLKNGPLKAWLKVGKNRYGPSDAYLPLDHFRGETRFALAEGGR